MRPCHSSPALVLKSYPRLVDERRRLKGVVSPLFAEISTGNLTQLAVNHRKELVGRLRIFGET